MTTLLPWPQACLGESPRGQLRDVGGLHPAPAPRQGPWCRKIAILDQAPGSMAFESSQAPGIPGRRVEKAPVLGCTHLGGLAVAQLMGRPERPQCR